MLAGAAFTGFFSESLTAMIVTLREGGLRAPGLAFRRLAGGQWLGVAREGIHNILRKTP